jgi:hypothetical protein
MKPGLFQQARSFSHVRQFGRMMRHSISFDTDPRQAARDSTPILSAKLVEYGTAK